MPEDRNHQINILNKAVISNILVEIDAYVNGNLLAGQVAHGDALDRFRTIVL
jgi:hypothetical protein